MKLLGQVANYMEISTTILIKYTENGRGLTVILCTSIAHPYLDLIDVYEALFQN